MCIVLTLVHYYLIIGVSVQGTAGMYTSLRPPRWTIWLITQKEVGRVKNDVMSVLGYVIVLRRISDYGYITAPL